MPSDTEGFFEGKRPWSQIKDRILGSYMSPYTAKIVKKGRPLLLIDAFAGPGKFEDKKPGSPLLICQAAEKYAKGHYTAKFINKEAGYHRQLSDILAASPCSASVQAIHGRAEIILRDIVKSLNDESVFLYIDPFGLDCEFDVIASFVDRNPSFSTEIVINLHAPILFRLSARDTLLAGGEMTDKIRGFHDKLTRTLGGDYWKEILLSTDSTPTKELEKRVVQGYIKRLSSNGYLTYNGYCPIQATRDGRTKYYMIFASPHPDAMLLFNDEMCKAFNGFMHEAETRDTLFADQSWLQWHDTQHLDNLIIEYITRFPSFSREKLWLKIVRDNFMRFTSSEYKTAVGRLVDASVIRCSTPYPSPIRKTKRLNDECVLVPAS